MTESKQPERWVTERTENIIGAMVIVTLVAAGLAVIGWAVPNYYVYFKQKVAQAGGHCGRWVYVQPDKEN